MKTIEKKTVKVGTTVVNNEEDDEDYIRDIYLLSDFPFTISIYNITLGQYANKYFTVKIATLDCTFL